jgi:pre-mRNA-processing factor 6
LAIENEKKRTRKAKLVDAMKKGENDPYIVLSVAKIFWKEKKLDKAKKWYFLI